jgi:hypothetical protein
MKFSPPRVIGKCLLCAIVLLFSVSKALATDNFPYGCIVFYNGAERVFTDFQGIDPVGGARIYSLSKSFRQGTGRCDVRVSFTTPYSGGCRVTGVTGGSNVTIAEVYNCPIDRDTTIFAFFLGLVGVVAIRKIDKK